MHALPTYLGRIMYLLTEWATGGGGAGQENIWLEIMTKGPRVASSMRHDQEPNILPSGPSLPLSQ